MRKSIISSIALASLASATLLSTAGPAMRQSTEHKR
jgi:hypothetical protein